MKKKRLIPILLLQNGKIVQSRNFHSYQILGSPINAIKRLSEWASDELIFLDISNNDNYDLDRDDYNVENLSNFLDIVENISKKTFMPITVGGKIKTLKDIEIRLSKCADKVSINSEVFFNKKIINHAAKEFGSQCIVSSIDVKKNDNFYYVYVEGGKKNTQIKAYDWINFVQDQGAGEILLNSIDMDGQGKGYDLDLIESVKDYIKVPLIIAGGVGDYNDFCVGLSYNHIDAVAAANIFHYKDQSVYYAKKMLFEKGFNIREPNLFDLEYKDDLL